MRRFQGFGKRFLQSPPGAPLASQCGRHPRILHSYFVRHVPESALIWQSVYFVLSYNRLYGGRTMNNSNIIGYHELTKHHAHRYAPGPGHMDWDSQPAAFRHYEGAELTRLDLFEPEEPKQSLPANLDKQSISALFFDSLALSAWKQAGGVRWALRVNPSSGNLHPTEAYLICGPIHGLCELPQIAHYAPDAHALEHRADLDAESWKHLSQGFPKDTLFLIFTSILWREAWKYGERAFRYCQHDIGHALAAISIAAARLGWRARLLNGLNAEALSSLIGLPSPNMADKEELEHPDCILAIAPNTPSVIPVELNPDVFRIDTAMEWFGIPNRLGNEHRIWPQLIEVALSSGCSKPPLDTDGSLTFTKPMPDYSRAIVHQRRSAVAMDGATSLDREKFHNILRALLPDHPPFDTLPWHPRTHLVLMVHRVDGYEPGLYCLIRNPDMAEDLERSFSNSFHWGIPASCPDDIPLRLLLPAFCEEAARIICCGQDIASDGCFSLGMITEFEAPLDKYGPGSYPRLFWECGFLGQILYLEAEKAGVRGTGIGCFLDDEMNKMLGLQDHRYQSLYHFTIGIPLEDTRITTLPAYPSISE